jgi:hypothetical protein
MVTIQEYLTALGVVYHPSTYMICPKCHLEKLTASEKKNIAHCWKCNITLIPDKEFVEYFPAWNHVVMNEIARLCKLELATRKNAFKWLTEKRHLPANLHWLTGNGLGAWPSSIPDLAPLAFKQLKETTNRVLAGVAADDAKARHLIEAEHDKQKESITEFFGVKLPKVLDGTMAGSVVYVYTNSKDDCVSLNLRQHNLEANGLRCFRRVQPTPHRGIFNPCIHQGTHWNELTLRPLVVEGEHNWLSLLARNEEWRAGQPYSDWAFCGCAMGGKNGADTRELVATFTDDIPWVLYDRDELADDGMPGGFSLVRDINERTPLWHSCTYPTKDLDELTWGDGVNSYRLSETHLLKFWDEAEYSPRPYAVVGKEINKLLGGKPNRLQISQASKVVWYDLQTRGDVLKIATDQQSGFGVLVVRDKREPLKDANRVVQVVKDHYSWQSLMRKYDIGASDAANEKLRQEVSLAVKDSDAPVREMYVCSHYDRDTKCLYVDELDRVLKLMPDGSVEIIQNGDEGIIFSPAGDKRHADLSVGLGSLRIKEGSLLDRHILSCIRWDESGGLREVSAKHLYKHHITSMFFDTLQQAKICSVFQGRAGGGKNTITNLTGMLFEGKDFLITHFPTTEKDLDTMTVDRIYVGFDEYDSSEEKQESAFSRLLKNCFLRVSS